MCARRGGRCASNARCVRSATTGTKCAWGFEVLRGAAVALAAVASAQAQSIRVREDAGHTLSLPAPARRIVSLAPHLTERAFAAGGGDRLVGVMRYSDHPPDALKLPV